MKESLDKYSSNSYNPRICKNVNGGQHYVANSPVEFQVGHLKSLKIHIILTLKLRFVQIFPICKTFPYLYSPLTPVESGKEDTVIFPCSELQS